MSTSRNTSSGPIANDTGSNSDKTEAPLKSSITSNNQNSWEEQSKLVYGTIYSLTNFIQKLSHKKQTKSGFISFKTNMYKLHYYETATGLKFVLMTDSFCDNLTDVLKHLYENVYVNSIVHNPFIGSAVLEKKIDNEGFHVALNEYITHLPMFD